MAPAAKGGKNQRKSGGHAALTTPKRKKTDLKVGCCLGTSTSTLQGFPRTRGCSLHKIERKIRWSVGYDHPPNAKKST